jgi:hypothetical protein
MSKGPGGQQGRAERRRLGASATWTGRPRRSAWSCIRSRDAVAPPSALRTSIRASPSELDGLHHVDDLVGDRLECGPGNVRTRRTGARPVRIPLAVRSQYGAPSPVNAGTRHTPSAEETCAARLETNSPPGTSPAEPNVTAAQSSAEPLARMLPSRAYIGVPPACHARVVAIPSGASQGAATGVMTEEPVP